MTKKPVGKLSVVAGPIGNLGDLSDRARSVLAQVDGVFTEDTRVTGKLLGHVGVSKSLQVLNEHSSPAKVASLAERVLEGEHWAIVTDAGTPAVSDPGAELVDAVLDGGGVVEPIPGPSAVSAALSASGFFAQRYAFLGFLPRKAGPASEVLGPFRESTLTVVLFESPHRFKKTLAVCGEVLGDRRYAIARELTKIHEQIWRGTLPDLPSDSEVPAKGEFTLVVEGFRRSQTRQ